MFVHMPPNLILSNHETPQRAMKSLKSGVPPEAQAAADLPWEGAEIAWACVD